MTALGTTFPSTPTVLGASKFLYHAGVPALIAGIETGTIGGVSATMTLRVVRNAITADGFTPSNPDGVSGLAGVLSGYSGLGATEMKAALPQIHSLLKANEVDIAAAIGRLKFSNGGGTVLPFVDRVAHARLMVHMPEGRLGAKRVPSGHGGTMIELNEEDIENILAQVVATLSPDPSNAITADESYVHFAGLPSSFVQILLLNDEGAETTTLGDMGRFLLKAYASGGKPTEVSKKLTRAELAMLPRLKRKILDIVGNESTVAEDRLASIAISSGISLILPEIRERDYSIDVLLPKGFSIGEIDRREIRSYHLSALELVFTSLIMKFAEGDASRFDSSFDPVKRITADGRSRTKKTITFTRGRTELFDKRVRTPTSLANIYARSRGVHTTTRQDHSWSRLLVQKVVAEILEELG